MSREILDYFRTATLLQDGHLERADEVWDSKRLNPRNLTQLREIGKLYCETHPQTIMVAATQFPRAFFELTGTDTSIRRAVYITPFQALESHVPFLDTEFRYMFGDLIINPRIRIYPGPNSINFEDCGSIRDGRLIMLTSRPKAIEYSGYAWNPEVYGDTLHKFTTIQSRRPAALTQHEQHHLDGYTATDIPDLIVDPWDLTNANIDRLTDVTQMYQWIETIKDSAYRANLLWLVRRDNRFVVCNIHNQVLEEYRKF